MWAADRLCESRKKISVTETSAADSDDDVFQKQIIEIYALDEVARQKAHVVELREIEDVRFQKDGRSDIHFVADAEKIVQKVRICQLFRVFVYDLLRDLSVFDRLCPDLHAVLRPNPRILRIFLLIILEIFKKVKYN